MKRTTFEQFDIVRLTTTKNVVWMSDVPGSVPDPNGLWSVVCVYPQTGFLLLQKESAMVRAPAADVIKSANFEIHKMYDAVENSGKKYLKSPKCKNRGEPVEQRQERNRRDPKAGKQRG